MMDHWELLILLVLVSVAQFFIRTRKNYRHRHFPIIVGALFFFGFASWLASQLMPLHITLSTISSYFARYGDLAVFLYASAIIAAFCAIKYWAVRRIHKGRLGAQDQVLFAYRKNTFGIAVLKGEYEFARYAALVGMVISAVLIICLWTIRPTAFELYDILVCFSLPVFVELAQYFGGNRDTPLYDEISGRDVVTNSLPASLAPLWEKYQQIWDDRFLIAWNTKGHSSLSSQLAILEDRLSGESDLILVNDILALYKQSFVNTVFNELVKGKNVLIIAPDEEMTAVEVLHQSLNQWMLELSTKFPYRPQIFSSAQSSPDNALMILPASDLLSICAKEESWLTHLSLVVYFRAHTLFTLAPNACSSLSDCIQRINRTVRTIVIASPRYAIQSAAQENLNLRRATKLIDPFFSPAGQMLTIVWKREGIRDFQEYVLHAAVAVDIGAEPALTIPALEMTQSGLDLLDTHSYPSLEQIQELQNNLRLLDPAIVDRTLFQHDIQSRLHIAEDSAFLMPAESRIAFVRDTDHNFPQKIHKYERLAQHQVLLHVVSLPYMLREYIAAHAQYFYLDPMRTYCAKRAQSRFNIAFSLLFKMIWHGISEREILSELTLVQSPEGPLFQRLERLFTQVLGLRIRPQDLSVSILREIDPVQKVFIAKRMLRLAIHPELRQIREMHTLVIKDDETGEILRKINYGNLYQHYLPFQVHCFNGKAYEFPAIIDWANSTIVVNHFHRPAFVIYRPCLSVTIHCLHELLTPDHRKNTRGLHFTLLEGEVSIHTHGYVSFNNGISFAGENDTYTYQALHEDQVPIRKYGSARLLKIDFPVAHVHGNILPTLAVLIKELCATLFPDNNQYLCVTTGSVSSIHGVWRCLMPPCSTSEQIALQNSILLIEDRYEDAGIVQSVFDNWEYILYCLDDYLEWFHSAAVPAPLSDQDPEADLPEDDIRPASGEKSFLQYGLDSLPDFLDLPRTHAMLRNLMGSNPHTRQRKSFYAKPRHSVVQLEHQLHYCDFCASPYPPMELVTLPDGRERCPQCSESSVDQLNELEQLYYEGRFFLENTLGLSDSLPSGIHVKFTTAQEVFKHFGYEFHPTPGFDPRPVGFASKSDPYEIYIENGAPYHSTLETLVHELTHIWQYANLDMERLRQEHENRLIEGHALWAGLKILETRGLAPDYCEKEKQRPDVYGEGYALLMHLMDQNPTYRQRPFAMMKAMYRS